MRTIPRRWTNSKGVNVDSERSQTRAINFLKKEVGIVDKKYDKKKNYNKKPYKQKQR